MASQFEAGSQWTVQRLRSVDATYLAAAYRTPRPLPPPIALAQGPTAQLNAGAIGVNEYWCLDTALPAQDVCWVCVQAHPLVQGDGAPGLPASIHWYPQGNNAVPTAVTAPALGPGANLSLLITANAGTYVETFAPTIPLAPSLWLPLDPANTVSGVGTQLIVLMGAVAGALAGELSANLSGCRMLGYPTSAWATGALWEPLADRGT